MNPSGLTPAQMLFVRLSVCLTLLLLWGSGCCCASGSGLEALIREANNQQRLGNYLKATELLRTIEAEAVKPGHDPEISIGIQSQLAEILDEQFDYDQAEKAASKLLAQKPEDLDGMSLLSTIYYHQHKYPQAEEICKKALSQPVKDGNNFRTHLRAVRVFCAAGRQIDSEKYDLAEHELRQGLVDGQIEIFEDRANALRMLALVCIKQNRLLEACALSNYALSMMQRLVDNPSHPRLSPYLDTAADALLRSGQVSDADPYMKRELRAYESMYGAQDNRTKAYRKGLTEIEQREQSRHNPQKHIELNP